MTADSAPSRSRIRLSDVFWLTAFLFVLSMHFWFPHTPADLPTDSYSTAAPGKKALYELLDSQTELEDVRVTRNFDRLETWARQSERNGRPGSTVLLLMGPARGPDETELPALLRWVSAGGTLVWATRLQQPAAELPGLEMAVKPIDDATAEDSYVDDTELVRTPLVKGGDLYWDSFGFVSAPRADRLVEFGGYLQAVVQQHGAGRVILVAGDFVFTNQSLAWEDNAALAFRLLTARAEREVLVVEVQQIVIDESLNVTGHPKVVGLLFQAPLRPVTIQALALIVLFAWWGSRRFGPRLPDPDPPRQNIVDHTDTLGVHAWNARRGALMVRSYWQQLSRELRLGSGDAADARILEPIARRLKQPVARLTKVLAQAEAASDTRKLHRATAAKLIHRLALIRKAAKHRRG